MIYNFKPSLLKTGNATNSDLSQTLRINKDRVNDLEYLNELKEQNKENFKQDSSNLMPLEQYIQQELETTDLYLFMKHVNPSLYGKHFQEGLVETDLQKTAELLLKNDKKGSTRLNTFRKYLDYRRQQYQTKEVIEVFDVLIESRHRLQIFDLDVGKDFLVNDPEYQQRMNSELKSMN